MNKQQLATKIWESANKMRANGIDSNDYKDFILGFIFYKYLSDAELRFLQENGSSEEEIKALDESDKNTVSFIQDEMGYFIGYDDLFSTWLCMGRDFDISDVRDGLNRFERLVNPHRQKVFGGIFESLLTSLSKLGSSAAAQTKAVRDLIHLIKEIPTGGRDYDILGYIYEYLIEQFASNAGKKAGEFYTPHEVSTLMAQIISYHLRHKKTLEIYDPTSGSGSLLITIGQAAKKYIGDENAIKYYAQELNKNTYNLTRMNLVMRNIKADNIEVRNANTLKEDWPRDNDGYDPLYVNAVVSNPPYSQNWDPSDKEKDPRYARFGLAPKTKADYAFLLHDLYHIKPDGIMAIVLPHGVLFRGGEEGEIRKNLIERNHIDAIIGLPANIFYGTGIPTIIMVLKQNRDNTDVLIIDASKGFIKDGKSNKLRASDIKRVTDTVIARIDVPKYARKVSREEIRQNDYNLNIPRYVDSSDKPESWDIYATMFGGIPENEIDELAAYWQAFPGLRRDLFEQKEGPYVNIATDDVQKAVYEHSDIKTFINNYRDRFTTFENFLQTELIDKVETLTLAQEENIITKDVFTRLENVPLIDKYEAYQLIDDEWKITAADIENIQLEGTASIRKVDPNMIAKKKDGKEIEVQDGWRGRIIPFELVHKSLLKQQADELHAKENRLADINAQYAEILDSLSEEEKEDSVVNDAGDSFVPAEIANEVQEICTDIETPKTQLLKQYLSLSRKTDKLAFINAHNDIDWQAMKPNKDGTFSKKAVEEYMTYLRLDYDFDQDTFDGKIVQVYKLLNEEKTLKSQIKKEAEALEHDTKEKIENLTDAEVELLLKLKWIKPMSQALMNLPDDIIAKLTKQIQALHDKYATTLIEVDSQINECENTLANMIDELTGDEFDMKGLEELQSLLKGKSE